jgi:hypothetical protein
MIPSKAVADLSEEARAVLRRAQQSHRQYVVHQQEMPFAEEVAQAHRGSLYISDRAATLTPTLFAAPFTVADSAVVDSYGLYAEVELLSHDTVDSPGRLLACLLGAEFHRTDNGRMPWPQWRLSVRHDTATDVDHAHVYVADLRIDNPQVTRVIGGETTYVGILNQALLYPLGFDVTSVNEYGDPTTPDDALCTYSEQCKKRPHFYGARFVPPEREDITALAGTPVRITVQARNTVDEHGLRLGTTPITYEQEEQD